MAKDPLFPQYAGAITAKFAPYSGSFAVIADQEGLHFVDMATCQETRLIDQYSVTAIDISPRDTYLTTCEKYVQGKNNLIIWNTKTGKEAAKFEWKKQSKEGPKSVKFSKDEKFCGRLSSKHHIEIYHNNNFESPKATIMASVENLGKKADLAKFADLKNKPFWFDGFEFVPQNQNVMTA